jgi:hypothetical protein
MILSFMIFDTHVQAISSGVIYHVGWYGDGFIVTQINGEKEGHQIVVWDSKIIGMSYPCWRDDFRCENNYSWGRVGTCVDSQAVLAPSPPN